MVDNQMIQLALMGAVGTLAFSLKDSIGKGATMLKNRLLSRFVFTVRVREHNDLFDIVEDWIFNNHNNEYRNTQAKLKYCNTDDFSKKDKSKIQLKSEPNIFSTIYNGKRIFIQKSKLNVQNAQDARSMFTYEYIIRSWNGKEAVLSFLERAVSFHYDQMPKNT